MHINKLIFQQLPYLKLFKKFKVSCRHKVDFNIRLDDGFEFLKKQIDSYLPQMNLYLHEALHSEGDLLWN